MIAVSQVSLVGVRRPDFVPWFRAVLSLLSTVGSARQILLWTLMMNDTVFKRLKLLFLVALDNDTRRSSRGARNAYRLSASLPKFGPYSVER